MQSFFLCDNELDTDQTVDLTEDELIIFFSFISPQKISFGISCNLALEERRFYIPTTYIFVKKYRKNLEDIFC